MLKRARQKGTEIAEEPGFFHHGEIKTKSTCDGIFKKTMVKTSFYEMTNNNQPQ
jgi:hypothetical protein